MEGLLALGISVKTNATDLTSRPVSMPLARFDLNSINSEPLTGFACYLVDISSNNTFIPFEGVDPAPIGYITTSDIGSFCEIPSPHILFAAHDSHAAVKPGTRVPIAFGLVDRLAKNSAGTIPVHEREQVVLDTFRPTLQQGVRALLELAFIPALEKRMPINRVNVPPRDYYAALSNSALCLAYGGDFYSPIMKNDWFKKNQPDLYAHHTFDHIDSAAVLRWDSWRFWEALAAGCAVVHLNFEAYRFNLPVMPEAWKHYIPIDLASPSASAEEIWQRRSEWSAIAKAGQEWAFEHYTPTPTTERILMAMAKVLP